MRTTRRKSNPNVLYDIDYMQQNCQEGDLKQVSGGRNKSSRGGEDGLRGATRSWHWSRRDWGRGGRRPRRGGLLSIIIGRASGWRRDVRGTSRAGSSSTTRGEGLELGHWVATVSALDRSPQLLVVGAVLVTWVGGLLVHELVVGLLDPLAARVTELGTVELTILIGVGVAELDAPLGTSLLEGGTEGAELTSALLVGVADGRDTLDVTRTRDKGEESRLGRGLAHKGGSGDDSEELHCVAGDVEKRLPISK